MYFLASGRCTVSGTRFNYSKTSYHLLEEVHLLLQVHPRIGKMTRHFVPKNEALPGHVFGGKSGAKSL